MKLEEEEEENKIPACTIRYEINNNENNQPRDAGRRQATSGDARTHRAAPSGSRRHQRPSTEKLIKASNNINMRDSIQMVTKVRGRLYAAN